MLTNGNIGWSFGGVLAFEAAHQLQEKGVYVKGIILIDSPYPEDHEPLPEPIIRYILGNGKSRLSFNDSQTARGTNSNLLAEFQANAALLGTYSPPAKLTNVRAVVLRSREVLDVDRLCGVKFDWLSSQKARNDEVQRWQSLVGHVIDVLEIPGNHFEAFDEHHVSD